MTILPPKYAQRLLLRFLRSDLTEEVLGDLEEKFYVLVSTKSVFRANLNYWYQVFHYIRPFAMRKSKSTSTNHVDMFRNYFRIGYRNLLKNKGYSFINIGGLALGMVVAILIGLWMHEELTFDRCHTNYDRLVKVMQHQTVGGKIATGGAIPMPLEKELRDRYGSDFTHIALFSWPGDHILSFKDHKISKSGNYVQDGFPEMVSLKMIKGNRDSFRDPNAVFLSASSAHALFGSMEPVNQLIQIDNRQDAKVAGVYEDLPDNSSFRNLTFIGNWHLYLAAEWPEGENTNWNDDFLTLYAQLVPGADVNKVSEKIKNAKADHLNDRSIKHEVFLNPMSNWYLRAEWKNGVNVGGRIQTVWMVGTIGVFVLLLACINFMNLSTARSEKRSREVGIRMAVGSVRTQLITQFLSESFLVVLFSFVVAVLVAALALPWFNTLTGKNITILWGNPYLWSIGFVLIVFTSMVAGSYPAFYLSSVRPIKALKGKFKQGQSATLPRKILVVFQFSISLLLAMGTIVVYNQVEFSKNRPTGYDQNRLITIQMKSPDFRGKLSVLQAMLKERGVIEEMAESSSPITSVWNNSNDFRWDGKDPELKENFATIFVSPEYGKTVGWTVVEGRDLSREFATDSSAVLLNEAAVNYMGIKDPVGMEISWGRHQFHVIGVVKNMIMDSPYNPVRQTIYLVNERRSEWMDLKLNPAKSVHESIAIIESVFKQVIPSAPFDYKFIDDEYARKFNAEDKMGKMALVFTVLAIVVSCLGLFGLASFVAEQKVKEIGIRKVMGASVASLWQMLSKDFVILVIIACVIAIPISVYTMNDWLSKFDYRTTLSWYLFVGAGSGALVITMVTVSFQAIKAALANPVKSLRSE
jgi:putative ABC transport system permease protein